MFVPMSLTETLARLEHGLRPLISSFPSSLAVRIFSNGRAAFAHRFGNDVPRGTPPPVDPALGVTLWDVRFQRPVMNAAGMFKQGEGYGVVAYQGAGGYVAGTTTALPRRGNVKDGVRWPAVSYGRSGAASNWLGLPNDGHAVVAQRLHALHRIPGCPVGASVSADPGVEETVALSGLAEGVMLYERAGVDYVELNESCPNVPGHHDGPQIDDGLIRRLEFVAQHVLQRRQRRLPVVVKFSTDTDPTQIPDLIDVLIALGYDGIILGNTSTQYARRRALIDARDVALYDHFTSHFGGGVSGTPVAADARALCALAVQHVRRCAPPQEFHVIRCGGVMNADDVRASVSDGVQLHQWYTGYYAAYGLYGNEVYRRLFNDSLTLSMSAR